MQTAVIVRCKDELKSCYLLGSIFILASLVQGRGEVGCFFLFASLHMENYNEAMCCGNGYKFCYWKSFTEIFCLRASVILKNLVFCACAWALWGPAQTSMWSCPQSAAAVQRPPPDCVLPAVIHITTVNTEHAFTLTSNTWPSDSWGFLLAPLHLFSYALLIYISVSLIVDSVTPLVCTSRSFSFFTPLLFCHFCCPSALFPAFF